MASPILDITVKVKGQEVPLRAVAGAKATLVVNTASACGFTPQYKGLQALYDEYKGKGLSIVGTPCNQFGAQEAGSDADIEKFTCDVFKVSFPLTSKLEVNGPNAHPLWKAMKEAPKGRATGLSSLLGQDVKWNFSKMLLDANGEVVSRHGSMTTPEALKAEIEKLLA